MSPNGTERLNIMRYPKGFIARVKAAIPDYEILNKALENGSDLVGRILDDNRSINLSPKQIASALRGCPNKQKVLKEVEMAARCEELYEEWGKLSSR